MKRVGAALLAALVWATAPAALPARADEPPEPPPEAAEGADYEAELADSLAEGDVEIGFSASGREGGAPTRRRRLSYQGDGMSAAVRDGDLDPLGGARVEGRGAAGELRYGRLAPRWGRGLVLGAPDEPWRRAAADRGAGTRVRGRAGEGAQWGFGDEQRVEAIAGRFARRDLAALRLRSHSLALGALADRRGEVQPSLALGSEHVEGELVTDRDGRWQAEALVERPLESGAVAVRVRGGSEGYRSLAEPQRAGPSRALALSLVRPTPLGELAALGAAWRYRPGAGGSRLGLELAARPAPRRGLLLGFAEQHGVRRPLATKPGGFRQGGWLEWRGEEGGIGLTLRHELWGRRAFARDVTRSVTSAGLEAVGPYRATLRVSHTVYRVASGESAYLAENEPDRLVLRALTGEGERSRIEALLPIAGGRVRAGLELSRKLTSTERARWTLDWSRRGRARK